MSMHSLCISIPLGNIALYILLITEIDKNSSVFNGTQFSLSHVNLFSNLFLCVYLQFYHK